MTIPHDHENKPPFNSKCGLDWRMSYVYNDVLTLKLNFIPQQNRCLGPLKWGYQLLNMTGDFLGGRQWRRRGPGGLRLTVQILCIIIWVTGIQAEVKSTYLHLATRNLATRNLATLLGVNLEQKRYHSCGGVTCIATSAMRKDYTLDAHAHFRIGTLLIPRKLTRCYPGQFIQLWLYHIIILIHVAQLCLQGLYALRLEEVGHDFCGMRI